jgi:hydrogenase nickel incorporation protein HypA/HybF
MHEMSLVEGLLQAVRGEMRAYPEAQVRAVRVRVGQLRQVEPAVLEFCYAAAVRETPLAGSHLDIQMVAATANCDVCGLEFPVGEHWFECPHCHSSGARLLTGDEMLLTGIDLERAPIDKLSAA